jgi:molybdenum-dependent DNA-binding transcriptional regulator ModE
MLSKANNEMSTKNLGRLQKTETAAELLAEYQTAQAAVAEVREKLRKELETALTR